MNYTTKLHLKKPSYSDPVDIQDLNDNFDAIVALDGRISTLINELTENPEYAPTAEVVDIRTGYDGTEYETAGDAVRALGNELGDVKDELKDYIDKKAVDGLLYEENKLYLTSDGEIVSEPVEIVGGGGGGGSTVSTVVKLTNQNGTTTMAVAAGASVILKFNFTSTEDDVPTGDGSCRITVGGVTKSTFNIQQGLTQVDIKDYLASGSNNVRVTCTDIYGNYRSLSYSVSVVELRLTSTFDDTVTYSGDILFKYTPYGMIEKTIHFLVDGTQVGTIVSSASGKQSTKTFSAMAHGVHTLDVYMTASLDGSNMESEHLTYDIMCVTAGNTTPMISSAYNVTSIKQGELVSIPYSVYDPSNLACDIELEISTTQSGTKVVYSTQEITVDRTRRIWNTRRYPVGSVTFAIKYGSITKSHVITVAENNIPVEAVTNDLELHLSSAGRSNNEANPAVWTDGEVTTTFTNMNWNGTGWVEDENGDTALRLNGDARAVIAFKPFSEDFRAYGKTIELEFAIRDVNNRDAVVISCMNGGIGFEATADTARLVSEQTSVDCHYRDEEKIRLAFVVESRSEYRLVSIYLNGKLSCVKQYPTADNFQQSSPVDISIGSSYCGVDIYNIRSYTTALTSVEVNNNFIADTTDVARKVELYNANNIYDEYGNISYQAVKDKIPVMTIIGSLPQSKGDKKTALIKFEDCFHPNLNFEDTCTIDVQGTSSQWYVRKNWKEKFSQAHQHALGQMPAKVFCMKVDYAEATGTHNTQNANLVHTLYNQKTPAQEDDARVRTTIYGFPCVIFHQATETDDPVFYGKANFNFDKGAENVYGFTDDYDVECWEFCNNTSDACNFKDVINATGTYTDENGKEHPAWAQDFESRYPDDGDDANIARLKLMHDWVVSTKNDLTKFRSEFENYFDLHFTLIYYVYTFVMLMVDQRAKNMMMTYWASTGKWQPWFYDNDTCLGINNEGQLVFDYYHEDTDKLNGANVYNGQDSVLWNNFRVAYADEIRATYQSLRNSGKLTYDILVDYFITNGSGQWSNNIYNEDSEFKYVSMLKSDNDASNLSQVRGSGEEHFKYFVENRLHYCDGKWYASDYANDYVSLRIYTPKDDNGEVRTDLAVPANANITVTPFSNMYPGARYKANGTLIQQRGTKNVPVTFTAPNEVFNDTETAVYGASELSSLGDLSPLYCGSINVSKATKLTELIIGSNVTGYSNPNLTELSVGTNKLLKTINVQNCPNLTDPLDLSGCPNIENILAAGSGITGVELAESGYIKTIQLPDTITNLTMKNQLYITSFTMEGYDALKTLHIENCPAIDVVSIISNASNLERLRLTGVNWSLQNVSFLQSLSEYGGIDENGLNQDTAHISGHCHVASLTGAEMAEINEAFPYLTITYDNLISTLTYKSYDGATTYQTQQITNGGNGTYTGTTPTRPSTAQYTYSFSGWSRTMGGSADANALKAVSADRTVYAAFTATIRTYTVYFQANGSTLQTVQNVPYGGTATYTGSTPTKSGVDNPSDYPFLGWSPAPTNITGNTTCVAQFGSPLEDAEIEDSWDTILANVANGTYATKYNIGNYKPLDLGTEGIVNMQIVAKNADTLASGGTAPLTWISKELLNTYKSMNPAVSSISVNSTKSQFTNTSGDTWESTNAGVASSSSASKFVITASSAGTLTIAYTVSSQSGDNLYLAIDGSYKGLFNGSKSGSYTVECASGQTVEVIAVYSKNASTDEGNDKATITFSSTGTFSVAESAQTSAWYAPATGSVGGWAQSEMRTYMSTLKAKIPSSVAAAIKTVVKTNYNNDSSGTSASAYRDTTNDDVWIPSKREIFGGTDHETEGPIYSVVYSDANSRKKMKVGATSVNRWWLRSADPGSASIFRIVSSAGSLDYNAATISRGVALGFCT